VDDDRDILEDVQERLGAIGHSCVTASCFDDAHGHLKRDHCLDYVLLDLEIPTRYGRRPLVQHGLNLLGKVNAVDTELPVVVMTAHGHDSSDIAAEVMRHGRAFDYIRKPFPRPGDKHRTLESAARAAFDHRVIALQGDAKPAQILTPFVDTPRELIIEDERVTLCGVEVWRDNAQPDIRDVLILLASRNKHGWIRIRGPKLHEELGRDASNPISKPIQRFRDTCAERMSTCMGLECTKFDVIGQTKGGGYHFTEFIQVVGPGSDRQAHREMVNEPAGEPGFNPYQQWVLQQIDAGVHIRQKDVVERFSRDRDGLPNRDRSSITRYLKELRDKGVITTGADKVFRRKTTAK
jgi:FixJ family two-component response regulator